MKQIAYIACPESQEIHVLALNETQQTLTPLQILSLDAHPQPMVISPDGQWLYTGVRPDFRVQVFQLSPTDGTLRQAASYPLPDSPTHMSLSADGSLLFTASYNGNNVNVIRLVDGLPTASIQTVGNLDGCHSVNLATDQQTLWVPALKQDRIWLFTLTATGELQPHPMQYITTQPGAGPRHLVFHPQQPLAYCINELDGFVNIWRYSAQKIDCLQRIDSLPADFSATRWAADIHLTANGRFLYTCERSASLISAFAASENGQCLALVGHYATEKQPRGFNLDKTGRFLLAAGQKSPHISLYTIDQHTGALRQTGRYPAGKGAMWVLFHDLSD